MIRSPEKNEKKKMQKLCKPHNKLIKRFCVQNTPQAKRIVLIVFIRVVMSPNYGRSRVNA